MPHRLVMTQPVITPAKIEKLALLLQDKLDHGRPDLRQAYARLWLSEVCGTTGVSASAAQSRASTKRCSKRSQNHARSSLFCSKMVRPTGFEPVAPRLGIWCSILLSYGRARVSFSSATRAGNAVSVSFLGWNDRYEKRHDGDAFVDQFARLVWRSLAVDRGGVLFAIVHGARVFRKVLADPCR